jgi:hypothetical protein
MNEKQNNRLKTILEEEAAKAIPQNLEGWNKIKERLEKGEELPAAPELEVPTIITVNPRRKSQVIMGLAAAMVLLVLGTSILVLLANPEPGKIVSSPAPVAATPVTPPIFKYMVQGVNAGCTPSDIYTSATITPAQTDPIVLYISSKGSCGLDVSGLDKANLGSPLNVSQTVNGFTITLNRVYADPYFVLVNVTTSLASGKEINGVIDFGSLILKDSKGNKIPQGIFQFEKNSGWIWFYTGGEIGNGKELNLQLELSKLSVLVATTSATTVAASPEAQKGNDPTQPKEIKLGRTTIDGVFTFDLTVSLSPTRESSPDIETTVNGKKLKLEHVTVTPAGILMQLRMPEPIQEQLYATIITDEGIIQKNPGGLKSYHVGNASQKVLLESKGDTLGLMLLNPELYNKKGEWILFIETSSGKAENNGSIHFTLP